MKTLKFGGSSLADASHFEMVKNIIKADKSRRAVIVSAPGKRSKEDNKITDLLYLCSAHIKYGVDHSPVLEMIENRYCEIAAQLCIDIDLDSEFDIIRKNLSQKPNENYLISRGEYLCGKLMAKYLEFEFIDAKDVIHLGFDGQINNEKTYAKIIEHFERTDGYVVIPGFYGCLPNDAYTLMSRGGSDITGALVSAALGCEVYENWTDVPGILMADPSIVRDPKPISQITYSELRGLTYMGAKVLHEDSLRPVKDKGIPINIRDTNHPEISGTLIMGEFEDERFDDDSCFITGIAGKKNYSNLIIRKNYISGDLEVVRRILEVFEKHGISVELMSSSIDGFSLMIENDEISPSIYSIVEELEKFCGKGSVNITESLALIIVVGRRMAYRPGVAGVLFKTLGENSINIRLIAQGSEEINIIVAVEEKDFEQAIRVLYDGYLERGN